jgi:hypothetical protein
VSEKSQGTGVKSQWLLPGTDPVHYLGGTETMQCKKIWLQSSRRVYTAVTPEGKMEILAKSSRLPEEHAPTCRDATPLEADKGSQAIQEQRNRRNLAKEV